MSSLADWVDKLVLVLTYDGRVLLGTLGGYDQTGNTILTGAFERVFSTTDFEHVPLGVYIVRGDNVALVAEVDTDTDPKIDWSAHRVEPIRPIHH